MKQGLDDKARLDFLAKHLSSIKWTFEYGWMVYHDGNDFTSHKGLRTAIDKAIRNKKRDCHKKGGSK